MEKEEVTKIRYKIKCPECDKVIKGTSASQVDYNLKVHLDRKHDLNKKEEKKDGN